MGKMALTKQTVIKKILSFNYPGLKEWIRKRLHGEDDYFPLYVGHEPNFSEFLIDTFHHIEDERFRDNFIEILGKLTDELKKLSSKEVEGSKDYIIELLKLCGNIRQFDNKVSLLEVALSGKFKGIKIDDSDLHADLLTTLASYKIAGTYEFWMEQFLDDSDKRYANPAFYALKDYPDKLFEHIGAFIDRFKGRIELVLGIMSLINEYGRKEVVTRFRAIESKLSREQKEGVNSAFADLKYSKPYKISPEADKRAVYKPLKHAAGMVGESKLTYGEGESLQKKAAEIFKQLGFDVQLNHRIGGHAIDIFIKKKKTFGNKYECYICQCREGSRKVSKDEVSHLLEVREAVRNECGQQKNGCDGCDAIIVCEKGFTKGAVEVAAHHGIILKTLEEPETGLR
jgi:hypothetical protein